MLTTLTELIMPTSCAACGRSGIYKSRSITFHKFPKDKELRRKWELAVRRLEFTANHSSRLCSAHFLPDEFDRNGQIVKIKKGAIPSVFIYHSNLQKNRKTSQMAKQSSTERCNQHVEDIKKFAANTSNDLETVDGSLGLAAKHTSPQKVSWYPTEITLEVLDEENTTMAPPVSTTKKSCLSVPIGADDVTSDVNHSQQIKESTANLCKYTLEYYTSDQRSRGRLLKCTYCEGVFTSQSLPKECKHCGTVFSKYSPVCIYVRRGKGEKLYQSTQPEGAFLQKSQLENLTSTDSGGKSSDEDRHQGVFLHNSYNHLKIRPGEKPFKCTYCEEVFASKCLPSMCVKCGKMFSKYSLLQSHAAPLNGEMALENKQPDEPFIQKSKLENLTRKHSDEQPYKSPRYEETLLQQSQLQNPARLHTGQQSYQSTPQKGTFFPKSQEENPAKTHTPEKPYQTTKEEERVFLKFQVVIPTTLHAGELPCQTTQPKEPFQESHLENPVSTDEQACSSTQQEETLLQKSKLENPTSAKDDEKKFGCLHCEARFRHISSLKSHMRTHREKPYKCTQCNGGFSSKYHLDSHTRTHSNIKPYHCSECEARFNQHYKLALHMRVHSTEMPYKCTQCTAGFFSTYHLDRHMRTHTGEKPYKCSKCDLKFNQNSNLTVHMRTHTGEKPYTCAQCDASFTYKPQFNSHIQAHKACVTK